MKDDIRDATYKGEVWLQAWYHELKLPGQKHPPRRMLCPKYPERDHKNIFALYEYHEQQIRDELGIRERTGGARMISSLWDEYIDDGCSHLTESTRKDHRITKRYYLEALGDHPMGAWSYLCSNKFRDHLKAKPTIKTNEAIRKHQVNLQSFLNWCLLEDVQAINRQIKIKMVQVTKKTPKK